jgi:hypothetical protein
MLLSVRLRLLVHFMSPSSCHQRAVNDCGCVRVFVSCPAFLGELWFPAPNGKFFVFTTQTSIIPNTFPYPDCQGTGCLGTLV